jgi:hypothetical protein
MERSTSFHFMTFPNPFQFLIFEPRKNRTAHDSFGFLGYIQCSIFSSIVLLRFPNIDLISPWFYNIFPFTVVFRFIFCYNIDSLFVINLCSFSFSFSFLFCRPWMLLWTYLVARANFPLTMEKAIWEAQLASFNGQIPPIPTSFHFTWVWPWRKEGRKNGRVAGSVR